MGPGAGPRDNENCGNSLGARRSYEHSRRTDQRTAYTNPVANDLFETNSCAAGTARQSRPGGRATRWSLPTADGTGAGVPTPLNERRQSTRPSSSPARWDSRICRLTATAYSASNGSASVAVSVPAASVAAKSSSSSTTPVRSDDGADQP